MAALRELLGPHAALCHRALTDEHGVALPPFIDHHVHLHLIDPVGFALHGISGVVDLGGDPAALAQRPVDSIPRSAYAGAFLTSPGGYPSGRSWAPPATVREIMSASTSPGVAGGATTAVDEQVQFGASVIKVALNATSGPVLDDATLAAVVAAAHSHGLPVVAHVEGGDTAQLALRAGVDALAHTPFTAILPQDAIVRAARQQAWISTLDIHRADPAARANAIANLSAFAAAGGRVLYGTDLGNGELPVGVNARELAGLRLAGLSAAHIVAALIDPWPAERAGGAAGGVTGGATHAIATFVAGEPPATDDDVPTWLARATVVPTEELIHDEPAGGTSRG